MFIVSVMGLTAHILEFLQTAGFHNPPPVEVPTSQVQWFDSHVILDILDMEVR